MPAWDPSVYFRPSGWYSPLLTLEQQVAQRQRRALTLEDLWRPAPMPAYPEPPATARTFAELGPEAARELRREALLRAAAAFGGRPGDIGQNLAGAALDMTEWQRRRLAEENARREEDYGRSLQRSRFEAEQAEAGYENERGRTKAQGTLAAIEAIAELDPEWRDRAEAAALRGDDAELREIWKEVQRRKLLRDRGEDPDNPFADEEAKARIQTAAEAERVRNREEEGRRSQVLLDAYFRNSGGGRYYQQPLQLAPLDYLADKERQAQEIRLEYDLKRPGASRIGQDPSGLWGEMIPDPSTGRRSFQPLPGQKERGDYVYFNRDGRTYVIDKRHPEAGYWETKEREGEPPPQLTMEQKLGKVEALLGRRMKPEERQRAESEFLRGTHSSKIAAMVRAKPAIDRPDSAPTKGPVPGRPDKKTPPPKVKIDERFRKDLRERIKRRLPGASAAQIQAEYERLLAEAIRDNA